MDNKIIIRSEKAGHASPESHQRHVDWKSLVNQTDEQAAANIVEVFGKDGELALLGNREGANGGTFGTVELSYRPYPPPSGKYIFRNKRWEVTLSRTTSGAWDMTKVYRGL